MSAHAADHLCIFGFEFSGLYFFTKIIRTHTAFIHSNTWCAYPKNSTGTFSLTAGLYRTTFYIFTNTLLKQCLCYYPLHRFFLLVKFTSIYKFIIVGVDFCDWQQRCISKICFLIFISRHITSGCTNSWYHVTYAITRNYSNIISQLSVTVGKHT